MRPREEGEVGAGRAHAVGVEEVIGAGVVLVDAALHQAQAEDAHVEVQILLRVTGDGGDVMDAVHDGLSDSRTRIRAR